MTKTPRIAVAGLTHLGVCMAIAIHEAGFPVLCWDDDASRVADAQGARFDPAEPGVVDFLSTAPETFVITADPADLRSADVVLIAIDTVLREDGSNDDSVVVRLLTSAAAHVADDIPIVVASQVRPGFTRAHAHLHPTLYYFMETLIFGRGLERAMHPERLIIGMPDGEQHDPSALPPALRSLLEAWGCPIHCMSYESAELTKLSANVVLAASITAANTLAELAAALGASWPDIERALRDDARIGPKAYLAAGMGIGGANIGRDIEGIKAMADEHGLDSSLASTMLAHSDYMRGWIIRQIADLRMQRPLNTVNQLTILGLAYKPGTTSTRGSAGYDCARVFANELRVVVHDPAVTWDPSAGPAHGAADAVTAMRGADVIVVATPWPQFVAPVQAVLRTQADTIVLDPYRLIPALSSATSPAQPAYLGTLIQLGVSNA